MENFKIFGFHINKLLVVIALITVSECFPNFQNRILNSNKCPNPCTADTSDVWPAVGHWGPNRGGQRNPFGLNFASSGLRYTQALHYADSDGDGIQNGVELGLVWNRETNSAQVNSTHPNPIGHPGICEPPNSQQCFMRIMQMSGGQHPCPSPQGQAGNQGGQRQPTNRGFPSQGGPSPFGQGPVPLNQQFNQGVQPNLQMPQQGAQFPMGQPQFPMMFGPQMPIPMNQMVQPQFQRAPMPGVQQQFSGPPQQQPQFPSGQGQQQFPMNQGRQQPVPMGAGQINSFAQLGK